MGTLKFLIEKEFKQTLRNSIIPKLMIVYPIMVMLIFPWAINFEVKDIKVSIVDHNNSAYSQRLIQKVDASKYFIVNNITANYNEAIVIIHHTYLYIFHLKINSPRKNKHHHYRISYN